MTKILKLTSVFSMIFLIFRLFKLQIQEQKVLVIKCPQNRERVLKIKFLVCCPKTIFVSPLITLGYAKNKSIGS